MTLTKPDKNWIKGLMDEEVEKFDAKVVEVKNDFYNKIDPLVFKFTPPAQYKLGGGHFPM